MIQGRLPSGRTVSVDTDDPKVAAATLRAFVQKDPYESTHARLSKDPVARNVFGGLATVERAIPFLTEAGAGLGAAVNTAGDALSGKGADFGKNWKAQRAIQNADVDAFKTDHPILSPVATGVGTAAPVVAALLSGGATELPTVAAEAPATARGVAGFLSPILKRAAGRAVAGAGAGYLSGVSQPGTLAERGQSGATGAALGGIVGTVAPAAVNAVSGTVAKAAGAVGKTVARAANKATGGALLDANRVAAQRVTEALKADGATPDLIRTAMNGFLKNGATDPALIDVASRLPSGGANTRALIRGAAMSDSARGAATTYTDETVGNLQGKALDHTRNLTPDTRPADVVKKTATQARNDAADTEYRAPYATTVDAAPVLPALEGNAGRKALAGAYQGADARRLTDQMSEIDRLRSAAGPETVEPVSIAGQELPPTDSLATKIKAAMGQPDDTVPVSLGTLHRTKVALEEAGRSAAKADANSVAGGLFSRAEEIDNHLAAHNPDYATARDNYARRSAGIDAIDHGATGLDGHPDDYAAGLEDLATKGGPEAQASAGVGYRQRLTDAIGHPAEGSTGVLNRIATADDQKRNLAATFGPEKAETYQGGVKDLIDQVRNARYINPDTGSGTAGRAVDAGLVDPGSLHMPRLGAYQLVLDAINKVNRGATLTDAERQAIVDIGKSRASLDSLRDLTPDTIKLAPSDALDRLRAYLSASSVEGQNGRASQ